MKRYRHTNEGHLLEDVDGQFVTYADHFALLVQRAQEIADLKAESEEWKAARQRVRESFKHRDDKGKCQCVYCTSDVEGLTNHAADYEMRWYHEHQIREELERRIKEAVAQLTARAQEIEQVKAENERVRAALAEVPAPAKTTRQVIHERRAGIYAVVSSLTTQEQRDAWGVSEDRPLYLNLTRVIDNLQKAADAALVSRAPQPERMFPIQHGPDIPWSVIAPFDKQCRENHGGQSLEHIAKRGGLDPLEAIDVLTCQRRACKLPLQDAILMLQRIVQERAAPLPASAALQASSSCSKCHKPFDNESVIRCAGCGWTQPLREGELL